MTEEYTGTGEDTSYHTGRRHKSDPRSLRLTLFRSLRLQQSSPASHEQLQQRRLQQQQQLYRYLRSLRLTLFRSLRLLMQQSSSAIFSETENYNRGISNWFALLFIKNTVVRITIHKKINVLSHSHVIT
jgi:hypothetical protein